ncbi:pentachlorophenol 4-monooxygenase [Aspergillus sclerotioniger CBS 115572]|uniref:Pentachlorophenol 4-monooxygenase n=1 Tax=Aspergillus sclerotioniger CBS 115572 TaxID=1450535 RepID=A0A317XAS0_9EURO|nr:pentachlorophenol 4-monooxygenase [Aspergillus sclerotioniger CBS 115572]PWY94667.1 pentachlorophenol 4-monooxygenase [Aspergillus sclerotioniger CBS 115572]
MADIITTDVLICGGGPVGLLVAYGLARQGVDSVLVEQHDKSQQAMYGRATTLYPRTLELLDQLGLLDDLNQIGYVARNSVTYRGNKRVTSRGWHVMFQRMHGTFLDYCLNIRQKYSEEVIRDAYEAFRGNPYIEWKLDGFSVEEGTCDDDYKVTSQITEITSGKALTVKSKYIVGADGGHSLVRRLAGIPFEGDHTNFKWVRIDGRFKTDMPDSDVGFASIESKSHGNVLWVQLDHGVKRIGFAMTKEMLAKYGDKLTLEDAKKEAIKSMEPFSLEIESIEWWTLYGINQRVADSFFNNDRVLLAGDACHTHSSGAAQGMNTGVHDAVNLAWKLGGVAKGWYGADMLRTYDSERRPAAQQLIGLDKAFSATISGTVPDGYKDLSLDANELFTKIFDDTIQFNIGLGIHYNENIINKDPLATMTSAGWRAPDALVYAPGSRLPTRLFHLTQNIGAWSVIVFAGRPDKTKNSLTRGVEALKQLSETLPRGMLRFFTVVAQSPAGGDQIFDIPKIGRLYYDSERSAHTAYTISDANGAVVIVRPDGILGYATRLEDTSSIPGYFAGFVTPQ